MNINYLFCFERETNNLVNVEDVQHLVEDHVLTLGNEFINMLLYCIYNCIW